MVIPLMMESARCVIPIQTTIRTTVQTRTLTTMLVRTVSNATHTSPMRSHTEVVLVRVARTATDTIPDMNTSQVSSAKEQEPSRATQPTQKTTMMTSRAPISHAVNATTPRIIHTSNQEPEMRRTIWQKQTSATPATARTEPLTVSGRQRKSGRKVSIMGRV